MLKINVIDVSRDKSKKRDVFYTDDGHRYHYNSEGREPGQDILYYSDGGMYIIDHYVKYGSLCSCFHLLNNYVKLQQLPERGAKC